MNTFTDRRVSWERIYLLLVAALFAALYAWPARWVVGSWFITGRDLRGLMALAVVIIIVFWRRKEIIKVARTRAGSGDQWWAFCLIAAGVLLRWTAHRIDMNIVSGFSVLPTLAGLILSLLGRRALKLLLFPLALLVFIFPWTYPLDIYLDQPMRIVSARIAATGLNMTGITALRQGTMIFSPEFNFNVISPCSGVRSMILLLLVAAGTAYLTPAALIKKWVIFLAIIPIAVFANGVRVYVIALIGYFGSEEAALGFTHTASGLFLIALAFGLLLLLAWLLRCRQKQFHKS